MLESCARTSGETAGGRRRWQRAGSARGRGARGGVGVQDRCGVQRVGGLEPCSAREFGQWGAGDAGGADRLGDGQQLGPGAPAHSPTCSTAACQGPVASTGPARSAAGAGAAPRMKSDACMASPSVSSTSCWRKASVGACAVMRSASRARAARASDRRAPARRGSRGRRRQPGRRPPRPRAVFQCSASSQWSTVSGVSRLTRSASAVASPTKSGPAAPLRARPS